MNYKQNLVKNSFKKYVYFFDVAVKKFILNAYLFKLFIFIKQSKNIIYVFEYLIHFSFVFSVLL